MTNTCPKFASEFYIAFDHPLPSDYDDDSYNSNINNNSIQFFIIYVPSQQLQGQLQTQHSADRSNYIMNKHYTKSVTN
jgi:hypothetical protein